MRARALIGLAHIHFFQGRPLAASVVAAEALSLGRDDNDAWSVSFALFLQGTAAFESGDYQEAELRSRDALEAADGTGEAWLRGGPLLVPWSRRCLEGRSRRSAVVL